MRAAPFSRIATDTDSRVRSLAARLPSLVYRIGPEGERATTPDAVPMRCGRGCKTITDSAPAHGAAGGT